MAAVDQVVSTKPKGSSATTSHHAPRLYYRGSEVAYVLPADQKEGKRLQVQHGLFEDHFYDGRLLPDSLELSPDAKVLDAGTGTGVWAVDLATQSPPSISITGIDISTRLFPISYPPNITFHEGSTLAPLSSAWINNFDLVHQRLMIAAFRPSEWTTVIANFYAALKPGGYLILMEAGQSDYGPKGTATERVWSIALEMMRIRGVEYGKCVDNIPTWLEEAGFLDVRLEKMHRVDFCGSTEEEVAQRDNLVEVLRGMSGKVINVEGLSWKGTAAGFEELVDEAAVEYANSAGFGVSLYWFIARKPL